MTMNKNRTSITLMSTLDQIIESNKNVFLLFVIAVISIYFEIFSALALIAILVVRFFYTIYYTKQPRFFWLVLITGVTLSILNVYFPIPYIIIIYCNLCFLECIRVVMMAILKYPHKIRDLESLTVELEKRVEERTLELQRANQKLQKANEELLELDKMKSSFVSQASHDLRTPLTAIKGSLDNLSLGIAGDLNDRQKRILNRATKSVDRLTDLINDVLDLNRIETGRVTLERQPLQLKGLVERSLQEHMAAADKKKINLLVNGTPCDGYVHADMNKIERVIGELINNAIKYTPEGGQVEIRLVSDNDHLSLSVKDTGIGMSKEDCKKIWERFYRTNHSQQMAKGSGLGLSIAKELVEMHDGSITVESQPGEGSTFHLNLPIIKDKTAKLTDNQSTVINS